ncbi:MAG: HAD-IIIC family phosphatase [Lachnospiraceae bacterium]|nr:HAD-IIIC family phosphatase [Lachnospiraceae bacterium]
MLRTLEYPFENEYILKKKKSIKKELLGERTKRITKKIAVLGGSTTHNIVEILELFLLNYGIEPIFYESEYAMYWQDAMFGNEELDSFHPDIIYIHTSNRNIADYPLLSDTKEMIDDKRYQIKEHFTCMWDKLREKFACPIIQNNFEMPFYRLLGNREAFDIHGKIHFLHQLNEDFYDYAREHEDFYINDIQYLSSCYGLDKWSEPFYWHMYKYALCVPAIPELAFNIANIIKSIYGKNKKALVMDLDNTLWGGIVGDDGVENLQLGPETSMGQVYSEFQEYVKEQKELGILLNINSKNEEENALAGLKHPDSKLNADDFICIKANWNPKSKNLVDIAEELNILPDSMVFVDDNPAEREIINQQVPETVAPVIGNPEDYIRILDHSGFFEVTKLSEDDRKRNEMYKANSMRKKQEQSFADYKEYLKSLEMKALIAPFEALYLDRIAQLTNKSNQFNMTTKRYSRSEIEAIAGNSSFLTLYGKLEDKFGDNGVVSVVIGEIEGTSIHIRLWLMSCRVLKRDMEYAMMDSLVEKCKKQGIEIILGYYYPTAKNAMVKEFYALQGFEKIAEDEEGNTTWKYEIPSEYRYKNEVIERG